MPKLYGNFGFVAAFSGAAAAGAPNLDFCRKWRWPIP